MYAIQLKCTKISLEFEYFGAKQEESKKNYEHEIILNWMVKFIILA